MPRTSERLDPLELVTLQELSRLAKRSMDSLYRDIKEGRLHAVRLGANWRVPRVEAERYLTGGNGAS